MRENQRQKEIAGRAERARLAMRAGRQMARADLSLRTEMDVLDWLKFAKSEAEALERGLEMLAMLEGGCLAESINRAIEKAGHDEKV